METHVKVLGWIYIVGGILTACIGLGIFAIVAGAGAVSGEPEAAFVTGIVGTAIAGFMLALSLPNFIAGYGLLKRRNWGRILAIILAVIHLFGFPIGTAIGIYALWALLNEQTKPLFT